MITIKTYEQARKLTQALHSFTQKKKTTLSGFRSFFAKENGLSNLQDAFKKDNNEKRAILLNNYITVLDDSRITLEKALIISDNIDKASHYLKTTLSEPHNEQFPITDEVSLLKRCEEILILFDKIKFYNVNNLFNALLKISFEQHRLMDNPIEMAIAVEYVTLVGESYGATVKYFHSMVNFTDNDISPEDGFHSLLERLRIQTKMLTWTKGSCGSFISEQADIKEKKYR
jgi:hypothetical protein